MLQINDECNLKAEDVRTLPYDIASDAHLALMALNAETEQRDETDETLTAIWKLLARIKQQAETVAGGPTFDRLGKLEDGKAVASCERVKVAP